MIWIIHFIFAAMALGVLDMLWTNIPLETAIKMVDAHDRFREELYALLCKGMR